MFVFSNPGSMLITKAQYFHGGQSVCRNKSLQKMFMMLGAAEKAGSGVDKILKGWSDANWRTPYINTTCRPDVVNLYLPMLSLLDADVKNGLIGLFGKSVVGIEHNRLLTLALAYTEGYVTNERLRYALNIHKADIYDLLKDMCNNGYLATEGHGRGTKYHIPQIRRASDVIDNLGSSLGSSLGSNLGSNLGSKPKRRLGRDELRNVILGVCDEWVSLEHIATTIGRNPDYLLTSVIPSMLEEGLLERMFPQSPKHPYQKYKRVN